MYASFDYTKRIIPSTQTAFITPPPPDFPLTGASVDMWFEQGLYYGAASVTDLLSISRASVGYAGTASGGLTLFASDELRITNLGLLIEDAKTNVVLWDRDLTNVVWTPSNITALKDQTGPDGVANSASSLEATAGNGTILQSITLASSARFQSAYIKRITGTGTINMTMDNGATWTAVTATADWTRVSIPSQTLANPVVGFQIVTSGDKIAVDFVQNEDSSTFASSPIPTTAASATRAADDVTIIGAAATIMGAAAGTHLTITVAIQPDATGQCIVSRATGTRLQSRTANDSLAFLYNATSVELDSASYAPKDTFVDTIKTAIAWNASGARIVTEGSLGGTNATAITDSGTPQLGTENTSGGFIGRCNYLRFVLWNSRLSDTDLETVTTP